VEENTPSPLVVVVVARPEAWVSSFSRTDAAVDDADAK
jgi:hypothetical protein